MNQSPFSIFGKELESQRQSLAEQSKSESEADTKPASIGLLLQNLSTLLSKTDILIQQPGVLTVILLPDGVGRVGEEIHRSGKLLAVPVFPFASIA